MGTIMSIETLMAIKERCERATKGPWERDADVEYEVSNGELQWTVIPINNKRGDEIASIPTDQVSSDEYLANADFIAHAREDIPALIAEAERLLDRVYENERWIG